MALYTKPSIEMVSLLKMTYYNQLNSLKLYTKRLKISPVTP